MASNKKFVYSTLAAPVDYGVYAAGGGDLPEKTGSIIIQGGANIPDKYMRTPDGAVVTPVTEEELDQLQQSPVFQLHVKNGYIVVKDKAENTEKVAANMEGRDTSAPLVDQDFKDTEQPITKKPDEPTKPISGGRRA